MKQSNGTIIKGTQTIDYNHEHITAGLVKDRLIEAVSIFIVSVYRKIKID